MIIEISKQITISANNVLYKGMKFQVLAVSYDTKDFSYVIQHNGETIKVNKSDCDPISR